MTNISTMTRTSVASPTATTTTSTFRPAARFASEPASRPLRLTRRGRVVIVLGLLAALLLVGFVVGRVSGSQAASSTSARTVVAQPGDTLWSIAARVAPDRDLRAVVGQLVARNHLHTASLQVGEQLTVPS